MRKNILISITVLLAFCFVACDGTVDKLLWEGREYAVTYKSGSGVGDDYLTKTVNCCHSIIPNSKLELGLETKDAEGSNHDGYTGYFKRDFSFYGWTDQDGIYYLYSPDKAKNNKKFTKNVTLEALWRNDITGDIITGGEYAKITDYTGTGAEELIIPRVITIWDDPDYPNGRECIVASIESGAITDSSLKTVVIPDTVTEIKENAFSNCSNLETVTMQSSEPPVVAANAFPEETVIQVPAESVETYKEELPELSDRIEEAEEEPVVVTQPVEEVIFTQDEISLVAGSDKRLTYAIIPGNATNQKVWFTSSNPFVATVDSDGTVTAIACGTAVITITTEDGGKQDFCSVEVVSSIIPVTGVKLNENELMITAGDSEILVPTINPSDATNKEVTYISSDTSIAKVNALGEVTGVSAGTAVITVTTEDGAFKDYCYVTVCAVRVTGVSLNKTSVAIDIGKDETLIPTVLPENADNKAVSWESSSPSVATVDDYGKVTGIMAGNAIITVRTEDGGFTASCIVKVNGSSSQFDVSVEYPTVTGTLTQYASAGMVTVTFSSADTSITSFVWLVDNRVQTEQISDSIVLEATPWKRVVKCMFSNGKAAGQLSIEIPGTQSD